MKSSYAGFAMALLAGTPAAAAPVFSVGLEYDTQHVVAPGPLSCPPAA
jgi:hypothetical protein